RNFILKLIIFHLKKPFHFPNSCIMFIIYQFIKNSNRSAVSMKKKLLVILLIIIIFIGGYFVSNEFKKKNLVNEAQGKAEEYLQDIDHDIERVQLTPDNYHLVPLGGLSVGRDINNNDELYFNITFPIEKNEVGKLESIVDSHDFPDRKDGE